MCTEQNHVQRDLRQLLCCCCCIDFACFCPDGIGFCVDYYTDWLRSSSSWFTRSSVTTAVSSFLPSLWPVVALSVSVLQRLGCVDAHSCYLFCIFQELLCISCNLRMVKNVCPCVRLEPGRMAGSSQPPGKGARSWSALLPPLVCRWSFWDPHGWKIGITRLCRQLVSLFLAALRCIARALWWTWQASWKMVEMKIFRKKIVRLKKCFPYFHEYTEF